MTMLLAECLFFELVALKKYYIKYQTIKLVYAGLNLIGTKLEVIIMNSMSLFITAWTGKFPGLKNAYVLDLQRGGFWWSLSV